MGYQLGIPGAVGFFLEKKMATHSSIPAWRIPWTEEPWTVHEVVRVRHDLATTTNRQKGETHFSFFLTVHADVNNQNLCGGVVL